MKKYISLMAGIFFSTPIYAESYVYGGEAHFKGALINQSCSVLIDNPASISIKALQSPIQFHFLGCSVDYYSNIVVGLSELNKPDKEIFYTVQSAKNNFDQQVNISGRDSRYSNHKFIRHIDLPEDYDNTSKKSVRVFLNQSLKNTSNQSPLFLLSIFYP
ncbi:hypothetical protein [Acinetobacter nematophilus]|uniref:Uncharacterized protein n=1 Tax=Acinetobacter nematophilus TaxID=2994642 RepID=A0A9X3DVA9_9GAMM|nr:hypothetical protein [Acinetobacter nematophilus]MCX5469033.1 hypothetical protein [Acinetobacter nematophilus]